MDKIKIYDANENNLNHVSLDIPRNKLVVITGVSGSGKSSLAFDTIFSEGQRRYVESLGQYARQFIGEMDKPDVEAVEGLSPAIAIDQKSTSRSPRSTVGTVTEIYDYLRLIFAKVGTPHDPETGETLTTHSQQSAADTVRELPERTKLQILSPVVRGRKGHYKALFEQFRKEGYVRVRVDGEFFLLEDLPEDHRLERNKIHDIEVVIDRIVLKNDDNTRARLDQAIDTAMKKSDGFVIVVAQAPDKKEEELFFSKSLTSQNATLGAEEMSPRLFSFNSPYGACPACEGLGVRYEINNELLVPDDSVSLLDGAIAPLRKFTGKFYRSFIKKLCKEADIDVETPYKKLTEQQKSWLIQGDQSLFDNKEPDIERDLDDEDNEDWFNMIARWDGVLSILKRKMDYGTDANKDYIHTFMSEVSCSACNGARLKPFSLAVTLNGKNIHEICDLSITKALKFIQKVSPTLTPNQMEIARQPLIEVENRLQFLIDVGLQYLTLARGAASLSGGEAQRIRLATQIGSGLSGVLYVLDEPSIGLHQHNNRQLIETLCGLRDKGNSVLVVEHDEDTIRTADWVIDIGPGAGIHGGDIVAEGTVDAITSTKRSLTGQYLNHTIEIPIPKTPRKGSGEKITVKGASLHNLKNVTVDFPLGKLIGITGLSGSGKSTLVFDILYEALRYELGRDRVKPTGYKKIEGLDAIDKVMSIDQSPIGRSPRSNPATYIGVFDLIRQVFAQTETAKMKGYQPGRFSFNVSGGRCDHCKGDGTITKEMHFLPNVHTVCEVCNGKRYNPETLAVKYKEKSIADVLQMTVEEALAFFSGRERIARSLQVLFDVGLGYIHLGQPATTLSGGEAQRIKLAAEFCKRTTGKTLFVLDEPSIGLHWHDLNHLITMFNRLVDQGNTVIVIEHNLDIIKVCDHIIDLGPEGGDGGGEIIAQGTVKNIMKAEDSYTGQYLKEFLK